MAITKEQVNRAIGQLKSLDLRTCAYEKVREHTDLLVRAGFMGAFFPKNHLPIYRGRVVDHQNVFQEVSKISYPPKSNSGIRTYNRLSTNKHQVFYGTLMPEIDRFDQVTAMIEVGTSMRDDILESEEYIQIGKWSVKEGFKLAVVGNHSDLVANNEFSKTLKKVHAELVAPLGPRGEAIDIVADFMSHEFSKKVNEDENWQYKISAAYGDGLFDSGIDAIQFPSVKSEGRCFNIALHSELVDHSLSIDVAAITRLRKIDKQIFVDWFLPSPTILDGRFRWEEPPRHAVTGPYEMKLIRENMLRNGGNFVNPSDHQ
jgi:hypothetical protein